MDRLPRSSRWFARMKSIKKAKLERSFDVLTSSTTLLHRF